MSERRINNFTITYETEDKDLKLDIVLKQGYPLKYNCYGKTWTKRTEATIYKNGFIVATNYVTKHYNDKDNFKYAIVYALKPIINKISIKDIRKEIWALIFKKIELIKN